MLSQKIRRQFLEFFKNKGHTIVPSSPVIPHDDPTLLFINAGMNQFKDVFLGKSKREYTSATTAQKCIRVGGKHNDLENVGHTTRHFTFFEMLGNFSFGDYFKKEAIDYAWELTLSVIGFEPEKLYATVFYTDEESFELWKRYLPEERIVRMGEKDNFWSMGETGPCGPCSELYYDRGESFGSARSPAEDIEGERFIEFWNLVFMESDRDNAGTLTPLPKKCVDTGAGLERIVALKMGVDTLFETDIVRSLIDEIEKISSIKYDPLSDKKKAPFRVIADHLRSLAFAIIDGVVPSNIERGYVLRKVLRRAVRYGRQLNLDKPFLALLLPRLIAMMGEDYPELKVHEERIAEILTIEEEAFLRTLRRGGNLMATIICKSTKEISGDDAFKLKDTYGLPLDEILLIARDNDLTVDIRRFEELEHEAKMRSRKARKSIEQCTEESLFVHYLESHEPSDFVGYVQATAECVVLGIMKERKETDALYEGEEGWVLLNQTPFYAEQGGQVGDQGSLICGEKARVDVIDCQSPYPGIIAHHAVVKTGELQIGDVLTASVDMKRRQKIANNHTATHLLHWALQQTVGKHVKQAGSLVEPGRLRFDFYHHQSLSSHELREVEALVNEQIRKNRPVKSYELSLEEAQKSSKIKQFFGEKYGKTVRVIDIEESKELCGGTHTTASGTIGYFKIAGECSIAAGIRRIEAVTGEEAEKLVTRNDSLLASIAKMVKTSPIKIEERLCTILQENKTLTKNLEAMQKDLFATELENLIDHIEMAGKIPCLIREVVLDPKELKECAYHIMDSQKSLALLLVAVKEDKCTLVAHISPDLVSKGVQAREWIAEIAPLIDGKGGGKSDVAQGGGTSPEKVPEALEKARAWIEKKSI